MILGFYEIASKAQSLIGWWPHCAGSKSPAAGHPRHGAVGVVCGERVAFCHPTPLVPAQTTGGIGGRRSSEVTFNIKQKTFRSLNDDWSVSAVWDQR